MFSLSSDQARRARFRPRLEFLEDRCCPSAPSYTVTDLGLAPSGSPTNRVTLNLNNATQVVGQAGTGNPSVAPSHAFFWQNGSFTDLGTLGGPTSAADAINNAASPQVVGQADTGALDSHGNAVYHAALWQNGGSGWTLTDLGTLGGTDCAAFGINTSGQVVGTDGSANTPPWTGNRAFVWQNGVMTDLNTLIPPNSGWQLSSANSINDSGQITGLGTVNGSRFVYLLNPSTTNPGAYTITQLPNLTTNGGYLFYTNGLSINSSGNVAGASLGDAALWQNGTVTNLGPRGGNGGIAYGINSSVQVVGFISTSTTGYAFLWQNGKGTNLNTLIPKNSGWNLTEAESIDDPTTSLPSGSIVGLGIYKDGKTHMFLAIDPPGEGASPAGGGMAVTGQTPVHDTRDFVPAGNTPLGPHLGSFRVIPEAVPAGSTVAPTTPGTSPTEPGNTDGKSASGDTVLDHGTPSRNPTWTFTFAVTPASGGSTRAAEAVDIDGILGDPIATRLQML
jgi:probable HAF family extracellular repeat protein